TVSRGSCNTKWIKARLLGKRKASLLRCRPRRRRLDVRLVLLLGRAQAEDAHVLGLLLLLAQRFGRAAQVALRARGFLQDRGARRVLARAGLDGRGEREQRV